MHVSNRPIRQMIARPDSIADGATEAQDKKHKPQNDDFPVHAFLELRPL